LSQNFDNWGLGSDARLKCQFNRAKHRLFVMLQHERQDLGHLAIAAGAAQKLALQLLECLGKLRERCAIARAPQACAGSPPDNFILSFAEGAASHRSSARRQGGTDR